MPNPKSAPPFGPILSFCRYQDAEKHWRFWHTFLAKGCMHGKDCARRRQTGSCDFGSRFYHLHVISGEQGFYWTRLAGSRTAKTARVDGMVLSAGHVQQPATRI